MDWFALLLRYDAQIDDVDMRDAAAVEAMRVAVEKAPRPIRDRVERKWRGALARARLLDTPSTGHPRNCAISQNNHDDDAT